jgi:hypothetical protein
MSQRFSYVKYDGNSMKVQQLLKEKFEEIEKIVDEQIKPGRAASLVQTYLEIAYMWTGKAIRDMQIERTGTIDEQKERNNE